MNGVSGPSEAFQAFLAEGRFMLQRCAADGHVLFPPRVMCPRCGSPDLRWVAASGDGIVYSTTVVRRKPEAGGDYNVALVELAEGPRMMSCVEGLPPEAVTIGMPIRAEPRLDPVPAVFFRPQGGGHGR